MNAPAWHLDAVTSVLSLQTLTTALVNTPRLLSISCHFSSFS